MLPRLRALLRENASDAPVTAIARQLLARPVPPFYWPEPVIPFVKVHMPEPLASAPEPPASAPAAPTPPCGPAPGSAPAVLTGLPDSPRVTEVSGAAISADPPPTPATPRLGEWPPRHASCSSASLDTLALGASPSPVRGPHTTAETVEGPGAIYLPTDLRSRHGCFDESPDWLGMELEALMGMESPSPVKGPHTVETVGGPPAHMAPQHVNLGPIPVAPPPQELGTPDPVAPPPAPPSSSCPGPSSEAPSSSPTTDAPPPIVDEDSGYSKLPPDQKLIVDEYTDFLAQERAYKPWEQQATTEMPPEETQYTDFLARERAQRARDAAWDAAWRAQQATTEMPHEEKLALQARIQKIRSSGAFREQAWGLYTALAPPPTAPPSSSADAPPPTVVFTGIASPSSPAPGSIRGGPPPWAGLDPPSPGQSSPDNPTRDCPHSPGPDESSPDGPPRASPSPDYDMSLSYDAGNAVEPPEKKPRMSNE